MATVVKAVRRLSFGRLGATAATKHHRRERSSCGDTVRHDAMKIPNADRAVVDVRKLRGYSLNPTHRTGKHKARMFAAALGITADDAEALRDILLKAVKAYDAELGLKDSYGQRYQVDFTLEWRGKQAVVRSAWIIEPDVPYPRSTSCYPLEER